MPQMMAPEPGSGRSGQNLILEENMKPTIGRIVIFKLTEEMAHQINRRRTIGSSISERIQRNTPNVTHWPLGAQAHIGNNAHPGEEYPLVVTRVWPDEFGPDVPGVNGQVLLDGNDCLWVTSVGEGPNEGQWHWPERV
jgi:hypothetical protein